MTRYCVPCDSKYNEKTNQWLSEKTCSEDIMIFCNNRPEIHPKNCEDCKLRYSRKDIKL